MKTLVFTISFIIFTTSILKSQDEFIKTGIKADNKNNVKLVSSDENKTDINIEINGFYNKRTQEGGEDYNIVFIKDFVSMGNPGEAALPVITKIIAIPNNKDVKIEILNSHFDTYTNFNILPYQTPPLRNSNSTSVFERNENYYSGNEFQPGQIVSLKEIAVLRDYRVAVITINPFQFNPANKELRVFDILNFRLKYEGYSDINNVTNQSSGRSLYFENIYKNIIFNYNENPVITQTPRMLIIISDALQSSITPFVNWKSKKGFRTHVTMKSEISTFGEPTAIQIKDYLTTRYNSAERPDFVLLVGDASGNNTITWFNATGGKSDHPYSCVAGTDIFPDMILGRISIQSAAELDTALAKLIQYESSPNMTQTEWYKRAFVLHSNDGIDPINGQVAMNVFLNEGGFNNVDIVSPSVTQSQITQYINGGVSWIWFIGHGSETSWASPVWSMSNMVNLNFGKRHPAIISIACSNTDLDYSATSDCFGEAWIERSKENSASNFCGSTELCAFYTTDTIGREMLYAYFRHGIYDFGSMLDWGKIKAYEYFNGNGTVVATINQYMMLGDPSQEIYSDVPKYVNASVSWNNSLYKIRISSEGNAVRRALVAFNQNNELKISGFTDSLGDYTFSDNVIQQGIPVNIVVTGKNLYPYDEEIILTSINYASITAGTYSLSQNYPNPFNPNTKISYEIPASLQGGIISLKVFDVLGNEVATLVNESKPAGRYEAEFDGANLSSGVYFYRLETPEFTEMKRMMLIK